MSNIFEGLKRGDLKSLVGSVVTIGEYISRIDDNVSVVTFSCPDRQAAQDLARFIQKSHLEILNASVSRAPDQKGNYIIFVELFYNKHFPSNIENLVYEVANACRQRVWNLSIKKNKFDNLSIIDISKTIEENYKFVPSAIEVGDKKYTLVSKSKISDVKKKYNLESNLLSQNLKESYHISGSFVPNNKYTVHGDFLLFYRTDELVDVFRVR